jgi:hypothetical protein
MLALAAVHLRGFAMRATVSVKPPAVSVILALVASATAVRSPGVALRACGESRNGGRAPRVTITKVGSLIREGSSKRTDNSGYADIVCWDCDPERSTSGSKERGDV